MRVIEGDLIIKATLLLAAILVLCIINNFLFVERKWNKISFFLHGSLLSGIGVLFCFLVDTVILGLTIKHYYQVAALIFTVLLVLCLLGSFLLYIFVKEKEPHTLHLLPNLNAVFTNTKDLAIILDFEGAVVDTNQPQTLRHLFGDVKSWNDISAALRLTASYTHMSEINALSAQNEKQFELHFQQENADYLVQVTPIAAGKSCMGYVIVMHDVSDMKRTALQLQKHNDYLQAANRKLQNDVLVADNLEAQQERLRLLKQFQADLMDRIEGAIAQVRHIQTGTYKTVSGYKMDVLQVAEGLRTVYQDIRQSIKTMFGEVRGG